MRNVGRRSETALGLVLLVVALAGAGAVVNWMDSAERGCTPATHAAICDDGLKSLVLPVSVFGTLICCAVALLGITWSAPAWTRRWAIIGLAGELACLAAGAALAATAP
jgi:hypothetical protein